MMELFHKIWPILLAVYLIGAPIAGGVLGLVAFAALWWWAARQYALPGLVVGWLPGLVAGAIVFVVGGILWPFVVPVILWLGNEFLQERI